MLAKIFTRTLAKGGQYLGIFNGAKLSASFLIKL